MGCVVLLGIGLAVFPTFAYAAGGGSPPKAPENVSADTATITGGRLGQKDDPIYLHLTPIVLPIINDYGAQQIVVMLVDFHMASMDSAEKLRGKLPVLKDAIFVALYSGLSDGSMRNAHALDVVEIKSQIMETVNTVFNGNHVVDVLIQGVSQRRL